MSVVFALEAFFPVSWVAFALAPDNVRLTWIAFQLYNVLAMLVLDYSGFLRKGSLEDCVAGALHAGKTIQFGGNDSGYITVTLKQMEANSIAEAREIVELTKSEILGTG